MTNTNTKKVRYIKIAEIDIRLVTYDVWFYGFPIGTVEAQNHPGAVFEAACILKDLYGDMPPQHAITCIA